jgi:YD repeat-containing protein
MKEQLHKSLYRGNGYLKDILLAWDILGRITQITDPDGNETTYIYDSIGDRLSETQVARTGLQVTTTYAYDAEGNRVSQIDPMEI